jgi:hypothetical protein
MSLEPLLPGGNSSNAPFAHAGLKWRKRVVTSV